MLLKKAEEMLYDQPRQAIQIGAHIWEHSETPQEKAQAAILLSKGDFIIGDYIGSVTNARNAVAQAQKSGNPEILFTASLNAAENYTYLDLYGISKKYRDEAARNAKTATLKRQLETYDLFFSDAPDPVACKSLAGQQNEAFSFLSKGSLLLLTAQAFERIAQQDSAAAYFKKSMAESRGSYWKTMTLSESGNYWLARKDFAIAVGLLDRALVEQKKIGNPYLLKSIDENLSTAWLALGNKEKSKEFGKKAAAAESDYDGRITVATNYVFENLQKQKAVKISQAEHFTQTSYWVLAASILAVMLLWLIAKRHFAIRARHTQDIISYLKLIRNTEEKQEIPAKTVAKNTSIPKETEALLLSKLEKFESGKKYLSKDISLAQMAAIFDTNTKYLSEVINKYKKKNFNAYINELRISYIVSKLKSDPKYLNYKVSYLAEECGFSSHSIFSAAFKSATGITPNVFIHFLSQDLGQAGDTTALTPSP